MQQCWATVGSAAAARQIQMELDVLTLPGISSIVVPLGHSFVGTLVDVRLFVQNNMSIDSAVASSRPQTPQTRRRSKHWWRAARRSSCQRPRPWGSPLGGSGWGFNSPKRHVSSWTPWGIYSSYTPLTSGSNYTSQK